MDDEPSSNLEEPPLYWYPIILVTCIFLFLYPFKTLITIFVIYATIVGYKEDKRKRKEREERRKNKKEL